MQDFAWGDVPNPIADGQIHRFGNKKNRWYVAWQNGEYTNAVFGDWKTGFKGEYFSHPTRQIPREKYIAMTEQMKAKAEESERGRKAEQERLALQYEKEFEGFSTKGTPKYLETKGIPELFGARTDLGDQGRELIIPTIDTDGKIWGYQRVLPDGRKFFQQGQRISRTFFRFGGEPTEKAIICEGWATGASLHMALGVPIFSAFNAGNLRNVALAVKEKFPETNIIIAGDDDTKTDGNPGRTKAEEAGVAVFPSDGCNDFNDLHREKGLDSVKKCFEESDDEFEEKTWRPLGYDDGVHFFYDDNCKDIVKMTSFSDIQLLQLVSLKYLEQNFPGKKSSVDWTKARNFFMRVSRARGPFDVFKVRGTGVWLDENRVVVNTGEKLITNESPLETRYTYIRTRNQMPPIHDRPLTAEETLPLRAACENFKWAEQKSGYLLAGWIAIARVAGALPVRPHVWVTGGAWTGKTTVMGSVVRPALGAPEGKFYLQGGTTEAGIRQGIKSDSLPIIFDEFETTGEASRERVQNLIELLRQTWSHTQGVVLKGSAGGVAVQYALSFAALVSSIRVVLDNDADRSRFSVLELIPHGSNLEQWKILCEAMEKITEEFGERLFARSIKMVPIILSSYKIISKELAIVINQRLGQQMGMLLAGYYSLVSDKVIDQQTAKDMVGGLVLDGDIVKSDQIEALTRLLETKLKITIFGDESYAQDVR